MRMNDPHRKQRLVSILCRIVAAITLWGVAMPSMAMDLVQALPNFWASATALTLTLATAAIRPKQ
jgi:hypothetical protein